MGNNEGDKLPKSEKPSPSPPKDQEQGGIHVYPDWAAVQAYYGPGAIPPPYFNPAATPGHATHPYMWAPQMVPPYGSPYAAMYPHGGIYGPPTTPVVATPLTLENPTRSSGNDIGSAKKPKESGAHAVSGNGKAESARNGSAHIQSHSTDCGTEGSCDRSDDSTAREDDSSRSYNGATDSGTNMQVVPGIPMASARPLDTNSMPTTELNHSSNVRMNANAVSIAAACAPRSSGIGLQDEREQKREKRKQSNRESARRSRLRKQAEMEELGKKVDTLTVENLALRSELNKLVEDSEKLRLENAALVEKLKSMQGPTGTVVSNGGEEHEKSHINTEDLLARVETSVFNGDHERGVKQ